jgi:hypothetical protein
MATWLAKVRALGLAPRAGMLALATLLLYAIVGPVAWHASGSAGLEAAAAAGAACLLGAGAALVATDFCQRRGRPLHGVLFGMVLRMGAPSAFAAYCRWQSGVLFEGGALYYLVVFFLVTLGVETALSLPQTDGAGRSSSTPRKAVS